MNVLRLNYPRFEFTKVNMRAGHARVGELKTPHGMILTPNFIFCATRANLKTLTIDQVKSQKTHFLLCNTYHLMLSPGSDVIADLGGLHSFMNWDGPLLTDSGGYQIFSMDYGSVGSEVKGSCRVKKKSLLKINEEGAQFRSYRDGSLHFLSPERCMDIQRELGADLVVQLDQCTPFHQSAKATRDAMWRSIRWGDRCLAQFAKDTTDKQALYSVVQGGVYRDLRRLSVDEIQQRPFFGTAIGGSLGVNSAQMFEIVKWSTSLIRYALQSRNGVSRMCDRPIHLLGIGRVEDILNLVPLGIDTFDCVYPTRLARHGCAIIKGSKKAQINLHHAQFRRDPNRLDPSDEEGVQESRAYIHHLIKSKEALAQSLLTMHNVRQMNRLMKEIREALKQNTYTTLYRDWLDC